MKLAACWPTLLVSHTALSTTVAPAWLQNLQLAVIAVSSLIYCSCLMMLFIGIYVYGSVWELILVATSTCAIPQLTIIMHSYMTVYHIWNK